MTKLEQVWHPISSPNSGRSSHRLPPIMKSSFEHLDYDSEPLGEILSMQAPQYTIRQPKPSIMATANLQARSIIDNMERFGPQVEPFPEMLTRRAAAIKERLMKKAKENLKNPGYFPDPPPDIFRDQIARKTLHSHKSSDEDRDEDEKTIRAAKSYAQLQPPVVVNQQNSPRIPPRSTSISKDSEHGQRAIAALYPALLNLSPPEKSEHPFYLLDALSSTSTAPLMITTSTAEEIQDWARQKRKHEVQRCGHPRPSLESSQSATSFTTTNPYAASSRVFTTPIKDSILKSGGSSITYDNHGSNSQLKRYENRKSSESSDHTDNLHNKSSRSWTLSDHDREETDIFDILSDASPLIFSTPRNVSTPVENARSESTSFSSDGFGKKTGLRKMSNFFKGKPEKNEPPTTPVENAISPNLNRPDLVRKLSR